MTAHLVGFGSKAATLVAALEAGGFRVNRPAAGVATGSVSAVASAATGAVVLVAAGPEVGSTEHLIRELRDRHPGAVLGVVAAEPTEVEAAAVRRFERAGADIVCSGRVLVEVAAAAELVERLARRARPLVRLRRQVELLEAAFDNTRQMFLVVDARGTVLGLNRVAREWLGRTLGREPEVGDPLLDTFGPADAELMRGRLVRALAGETFVAERSVELKDGSQVWVELVYQPIPDEAGGVGRVVISGLDITERRREDAARAAFASRVQQLQRQESLALMAGGVAHDFNNALMVILGNASLALMELEPAHPAQASIEAIGKAARRAAELTARLLAYAGAGKFSPRPGDVSELVGAMRSIVASTLPRNASLRFDLASGLPPVNVDIPQVQQLVHALLLNAAESYEGQLGLVTVRTRLVHADRAMLDAAFVGDPLPEGTYVAIEVEDGGCGMSDATLARIFEPFFSTKLVGRGIGLAGALGIARAHRGTVAVRTVAGRGSVFSVLLPVTSAPAVSSALAVTSSPAVSSALPVSGAPAGMVATASGASPSGPTSGAGAASRPASPTASSVEEAAAGGAPIRLLLADDDDLVRAVMKSALERGGFVLRVVADGDEAVRSFRDNPDGFDIVILDLTMPRMGGVEAFDRIRAIRPDAAVILSSGYTEEQARERFGDRGLLGFIQKPFQAQDLARELRAWVSARRG